MQTLKENLGNSISIHALRGEGDILLSAVHARRSISIHALRGEGDAQVAINAILTAAFQSTPSVGRATRPAADCTHSGVFQSTPSVGRATSSAIKDLS